MGSNECVANVNNIIYIFINDNIIRKNFSTMRVNETMRELRIFRMNDNDRLLLSLFQKWLERNFLRLFERLKNYKQKILGKNQSFLLIITFPSGNGQIAHYSEQECMLLWIRPNYIETWQQMDFVKLLFSLYLFTTNGDFIGLSHVEPSVGYERIFHTEESNGEQIFDSEESTLNCGQLEQSLQRTLKVTEIMSQPIFVVFSNLQICLLVLITETSAKKNKTKNSSSEKIFNSQEITKTWISAMVTIVSES
ncbi:unnamed protein product [Brugia timori]|uniref:Uncharacterized protein n=1 Tax=Brugia timori TaxID=42155 RepID=A0A3P7W395_9BILA|nr:unnamed protein product [Brugia timori]